MLYYILVYLVGWVTRNHELLGRYLLNLFQMVQHFDKSDVSYSILLSMLFILKVVALWLIFVFRLVYKR